ncbi:MAG: TetR/AcrR family transcriptional regulator [Crocinitomicaceae bacterium]|jgi:AcrR family transcriptional regulator|nr:TetR/AcrR family transcriptional regulator [Crocinitomicaceae bacterium]
MEKREEILIGATNVFMSYGIKSVTMDDLARELGISKKTIYLYFKDKNDLIESILNEHLSKDQNRCIEVREDAENAIESFYKVISMVMENMGRIHPSVFYDLQKYHPKAWVKVEEHQTVFVREVIRRNIERGRQEGMYRADFDAEILAQMYVKLTDAAIRREIKDVQKDDLAHVFNEIISLIVHSMITEKGKQYISQKQKDQDA